MTAQDPTYLGIDFGTSGCRGIVIDAKKNILAEARQPLPAAIECDGRIEQDSALWIAALEQLLEDITQRTNPAWIARLALNGTSGSVLLIDSDGQAQCPARMYNDSSGQSQLLIIRAAADSRNSLAVGGSSTLARVRALIEDYPQSGNVLVAHQADFLSAWLSGKPGFSDYHNALKLGVDPTTLQWPEWIESLLPANALPRVVEPGSPLGLIKPEWARRFGFSPGLQVCAGTTDANAAFIATGASRPGQAVTSLGSTLVVKLTSRVRIDRPDLGVYSHRLGSLWLVGGASNAGCAVLRDFFSDDRLTELSAQMDPDQPTGFDFYPLIRPGERFPVPDPERQPCLEPRPASDARFLQGILEALTRIEQSAYHALQKAGAAPLTEVFTMGGGSRNYRWRQMRERALGVPVHTAQHSEAAYGSALLALQGLRDYCR